MTLCVSIRSCWSMTNWSFSTHCSNVKSMEKLHCNNNTSLSINWYPKWGSGTGQHSELWDVTQGLMLADIQNCQVSDRVWHWPTFRTVRCLMGFDTGQHSELWGVWQGLMLANIQNCEVSHRVWCWLTFRTVRCLIGFDTGQHSLLWDVKQGLTQPTTQCFKSKMSDMVMVSRWPIFSANHAQNSLTAKEDLNFQKESLLAKGYLSVSNISQRLPTCK